MFREYKKLVIKRVREWNIERCFSDTNFILVLCPMRSGSTLLQHLLTGENNFLTAGETKIVYKSESDLKQLIFKVFSSNNNLGFRQKTVVDKCVDNELIEDFDIINYPRLKTIFLLRDPSSTISSLLNASGFAHSDSIESASSYYLERVENLLSLASHLQNRSNAFFLSYDQLTENQETTLEHLSKFLETKQPLRATYQLHKWTGVAGKGDITNYIQSGVIVKNKKSNNIDCPEQLKKVLNHTYRNAKQTLETICRSIND